MIVISYQQLQEARQERVAARQALDRAHQAETAATGVAKNLKEVQAEADEKLKQLDTAVKTGSHAIARLQEFHSTLLAAQSDDRKAFDQLGKWAQDPASPLSNAALQAWTAIIESHESLLWSGSLEVPWKEGVDPAKLSLVELKADFPAHPSQVRIALLAYISKRNDIPKKERMSFLIEVIRHDASLRVVEHAARYFRAESRDKIKSLYIAGHLKWWDQHKDEIH